MNYKANKHRAGLGMSSKCMIAEIYIQHFADKMFRAEIWVLKFYMNKGDTLDFILSCIVSFRFYVFDMPWQFEME